jgi:hypothetical protein
VTTKAAGTSGGFFHCDYRRCGVELRRLALSNFVIPERSRADSRRALFHFLIFVIKRQV